MAKRRWVLAMKRLDVNSAGMWEPKKADVLCSRHFKKSDFDTRGPNIKLKPGVIPSIFEFPSHFQDGFYSLQRRPEKVHGRRNTPLKTLPVSDHNHQSVDAPSSTGEFQSQFISEHSYSIMDSPKKLKYKLDQVISELEDAKDHLKNALNRERQRRESLRTVIQELKNKCLISPETACKLDVYCCEWCEAGTLEKTSC
uniref:THAP-type domain-containing protein n=1 Tax=Pelusios castaneus TaxID=367368 RepID=A0A8C8RWS1_9SAUR